MGGSSIALQLLGGLDISRDGRPIDGFVSSRGPALVAYLSVTGRSHTREHLAGLLWSEAPEKDARASLRVVLSNLRQTLGAEHLAISGSQVALRGDTGIASDADEFMRIITATADADPSSQPLEYAADLYVGDLLAGFSVRDAPLFDEWVAVTREHHRIQAIRLFERLAELRSRANQHEAAIAALERLLVIEPWHESAFRQYMTQLALTGRRAAALVQYDNFTHLLDSELGAAPETNTVTLYEQIRDGLIEAPSPSPPVAGRPASYPPIHDTRMRIPASSFVGRQPELATIATYLHDPAIRLVSLVGPGGSGKTRLALEALKEYEHEFDDGVAAVSLVGIGHPDQIAFAVVDALELPVSAHENPLRILARRLGESCMLLLLDNFEHLLDGAHIVNQLLDALPGVCVLVTSRERLALQAEWFVPVAGLPVPDAGVHDREARNAGAIRLFIDRARQVRPDFLPDTDELRQIATICLQVDGYPLGIELAAGWMRTMGCAEIASHVQEGLNFLSTNVRDVPERHRSLRAVFDRSWALLDERAKRMFASLSVFTDGFTANSAQAVTGAELQDLIEMVEKSLVRREESGRYILHELLRQYAAERLAEDPDFATAVGDSHASHFADLMVEAETLLTGAQQFETLGRIKADRTNLSNAWAWMLARRQYKVIGTALDGVGLFHYLDNSPIQGLSLMRHAARTLRSESPIAAEHEILIGRIYGWQAHSYITLVRLDAAEEQLALAEKLLSRHGSVSQLAYGSDIKGRIASRRGNFQEARRRYEQLLREAQASRDRFREGVALNRLGGTAYDLGDLPAAKEGFKRSIASRREIRDWEGVARDLNNLADVMRETGNYERAYACIEESTALHRERGSGTFAPTLETWAHLALQVGRLDEAAEQLDRCTRSAEDRGDQINRSVCLLRSAELAMLHGDNSGADALLAESRKRFGEHGFRSGIVEWGIVAARHAIACGEPDKALRYARASLSDADEMGNVLRAAIALGVAGRALSSLGCMTEATDSVTNAMGSLRRIGAIPALFDAAVAACRVQIETTELASHDAANLAAVLEFVRRQRATWYSTREEASEVLEELERTSSPDARARTRERARSWSLDAVLSHFEAQRNGV